MNRAPAVRLPPAVQARILCERYMFVGFSVSVAQAGPGASTARFRDPSWNRRFPIHFLLRVADFRAWRLHGQISGSGHPSWNRRFLFHFGSRPESFCKSRMVIKKVGLGPDPVESKVQLS